MNWVAAIPALPALAFLGLVALPRRVRNRGLWLSIGASGLSAVLALIAFARVWPGGGGEGEAIAPRCGA